MGSIKFDKSGRKRHWTDGLRKYVLSRNAKKQVKSSQGQLPLFQDVPVGHLEKPKKTKLLEKS